LTDKAIMLGFLAASLVPALLTAIFSPLSGGGAFLNFIVSFAIFYPFSAFATALLGAPLFVLLDRFKLVSWWTATLGGAIIGVVMIRLVIFNGYFDLSTIPIYALMGGLSGLVFWVVARIASRK
jgi:hypothetical protein